MSNANTNNNNDFLISELSDVRQKYSETIFQLHKSNESLSSLNQIVDSLKTQNEAHKLHIDSMTKENATLQHENNSWKNEDTRMKQYIHIIEQEKLTTIESVMAKDREIGKVRKELKTLQARLKQNQAATAQNLRYFHRVDNVKVVDEYEVKNLLAHRDKKSGREFLVQWKETWEQESSLNCPKIKSAYLRKNEKSF